MAMCLDVLVFGSANVDYITYVSRLPQPGETLQGRSFERSFGGKGANQCVAAARLGASTALVAKLGTDASGNDYVCHLQQQRVNVDYVEQVKEQPTGMAQIAVSDDGENQIIIIAGANALLTIEDIERSKELFKNAAVLLCQLETDVNATVDALRCFKGVSILNAAPAIKDMPDELLRSASILCVNELEAAQLTGRDDVKTLDQAREAATELIDKGANSVIITMGALGAVYLSKDNKERCSHVPAKEVQNVVDTTGAGDAFIGGLAYYLSQFPNLPREAHISAANDVAAYSIQYRGAQPSYPGQDMAQTNLCNAKIEFSVITERPQECKASCARNS